MIRRPLGFRLGGYKTSDLLWRNITKWWSRRGGWIVNSLLLDEVFSLRCIRALARRNFPALVWNDAIALQFEKAFKEASKDRRTA